jgi:hypothetical protein
MGLLGELGLLRLLGLMGVLGVLGLLGWLGLLGLLGAGVGAGVVSAGAGVGMSISTHIMTPLSKLSQFECNPLFSFLKVLKLMWFLLALRMKNAFLYVRKR